MAERYGTIPEKYTKAWWEYFWEYYKWYVIVPLILVIAIGSTIYSKLTSPKYDITLTYAANNVISTDDEDVLSKKFSSLCDDIDEDGKGSVYITQLLIQSEPSDQNAEFVRGAREKLQLSFAADEKYIYIVDKEVADLYTGPSPDYCPFAPVEEWAKELPEDAELLTAHGINYGVSLSGNQILKDCGIDLSGHYIVMRYYPREDQKKQQLEGYNAAVNLANSILTSK